LATSHLQFFFVQTSHKHHYTIFVGAGFISRAIKHSKHSKHRLMHNFFLHLIKIKLIFTLCGTERLRDFTFFRLRNSFYCKKATSIKTTTQLKPKRKLTFLTGRNTSNNRITMITHVGCRSKTSFNICNRKPLIAENQQSPDLPGERKAHYLDVNISSCTKISRFVHEYHKYEA
jgi:hypothetical protein